MKPINRSTISKHYVQSQNGRSTYTYIIIIKTDYSEILNIIILNIEFYTVQII